MKTVSIGDTHGKAIADVVLKIINEYDKFIFMGDYVDNPDIENLQVKKNLSEIIALKKRYPGKIILLWGNHDIQYLLDNEYYCSGYRPGMKKELHEIFYSNEELFQIAYQSGDYLWTHAGVSGWWFEFRFLPFAEKQKEQASIAELLNIGFDKRYKAIFDVGYSRAGNCETGGPLWCDIEEMEDDPWLELNQIAGHNRVDQFERIKKENREIVFIDILHNAETVDSSYFFYKEI
jgi:calcineurin-like phosphoesterase family protein